MSAVLPGCDVLKDLVAQPERATTQIAQMDRTDVNPAANFMRQSMMAIDWRSQKNDRGGQYPNLEIRKAGRA
jgi:hypothetical protein